MSKEKTKILKARAKKYLPVKRGLCRLLCFVWSSTYNRYKPVKIMYLSSGDYELKFDHIKNKQKVLNKAKEILYKNGLKIKKVVETTEIYYVIKQFNSKD